MMRASFSQLGTFSQCSWSWKLAKVDRVPQLQAGWFIHGSAVHAAIEEWELSGRTASWVISYTEAWDKELAEAEAADPDKSRWLRGPRSTTESDLSRRFGQGMDQVGWYVDYVRASEADWEIATMPDGSPAIEVGFDLELGGVQVIGYIDQVLYMRQTGTYRVRDLKTGNRVKSSQQLGLYRVALAEVLGLDASEGDYLMLKDGTTTEPYRGQEFDRPYFEKTFAAMHRGVDGKVFIPNPGDGCFTCTSKLSCAYRA